jgi:hypothetical protein
MFKNKIALLGMGFLFLGQVLAAQQGDGLIKEIFLIKQPIEKYITPPLEIRISINMAAPAYYKLFDKDNIISAGLLPKGDNSLSIPTESFFEKTAKHTFSLELKTESGITKKDIVLDVQLATLESPKKIEVEPEIHEYKLSLYIGNQLVSTRIKQQELIPHIQPDLQLIQQNHDPFYVPKENDDLMRNTVSILDAIGLAYQLIKSVSKKKEVDESSPTIQLTHFYSIKFFRKNSQGFEEEIIAMIGLTTR